MSNQWFILRSKPHKESLLFDQLLINKVKVYYPRIHVQPVNPRSRHIRSYFPGYMFVNVDLEQVAVSTLAWIPGASHMVSFDNEPASVPDEIVAAIQRKVEAINAAGGEMQETLHKGDRVTITEGPFAGYEGIFDLRLDSTKRVRMLLKLVQDHQLRMDVPSGWVKKQE